MFERYLHDASELLITADACYEARKNPGECKRLWRASIFHSASAMEAYLNFLASSFTTTDLPEAEIAYLNDNVLVFHKGKKKLRIEYHRIEEKLRVILNRFYPSYDLQSSNWSALRQFKRFRDLLVHPRQIDDDMTVNEYRKIAKRGLGSTINIINTLSKKIYRKPLRKKLTDLVPN